MPDDWRKKLREIGDALRKKSSLPDRGRLQNRPVTANPPKTPSTPPIVRSTLSTPRIPSQTQVSKSHTPRPSTTGHVKSEPAPSASAPAPRYHEPQPIPAPPEPRSTPARGVPALTIGFDFGTSTTKVCIRPTLGDGPDVSTYPIVFDPHARDPLFSPSTVGYSKGRLYFGAAAEGLNGDCQIWCHPKVCVACEAENTFASQTCFCASQGATPQDLRSRFAAGQITAGPADLVTLYMSWALGQVLGAIPEALRKTGPPSLTCNVGVPVDQIDLRSRLRSAYEQMAWMAWRLRGQVTQGIEAATALGWLKSLKAAPPPDGGAVALCPETGAAVVAHITNPTTREGMYALVDIGAWTTDISFFRLTDVSTVTEGVRTEAFYEAESHRVAASRIDQKASELLIQNRAELAKVMPIPARPEECQLIFRSIRETGASRALSKPVEERAASGCLECARSVTSAAVTGCFASTRAKAKRKEGPYNQGDWKRLSVFLLGGGSEEACFEEFLKGANLGISIVRLPQDRRLRAAPSAVEPARTRRLQVATGLAVPIALWPKQFLPSQVERIPAQPRTTTVRPRPDRDELYPK